MKSEIKADLAAIIALIFIMLCAVVVYHFRETIDQVSTAPAVVTVQRGDTLWSIAEENCPNQDPREVVNQIQSENCLGEYLLPGDKLLVPREVVTVQEAKR